MKHNTILVVSALLACGVSAQQPDPGKKPAPATVGSSAALAELADAIAAEQQEGDLAKAERLYRAALTDANRSEAARRLATARLAALLQRLGRTDEAQALRRMMPDAVVSLDDVTNQDAARQRELREQARQLLTELTADVKEQQHLGSELSYVPVPVAQKLLWLGRAAVPEVIAKLQGRASSPYGASDGRCVGLAEFLWMVGGPEAAAFLQESAGDERLRDVVAMGARKLQEIDVDAPALRAYLDHEDWEIAGRVLGPAGSNGLLQRMSVEQLLAMATRGDVRRRHLALEQLVRTRLDDAQVRRALVFVREALAGSDPEYGNAADRFLSVPPSQNTLEGLRLLVARLPDLHRRNIGVGSLPFGEDEERDARRFGPDGAQLLVPAVEQAVAAMGDDAASSNSHASRWLAQLMWRLIERGGARAAAAGVGWLDAGYDVAFGYQNAREVDAATSVAVLERFDRLSASQRSGVLRGADLSRSLPALKGLIERYREDRNVYTWLTVLVAGTGAPDAAAVLRAEWRDGRLGGNDFAFRLIEMLKARDGAAARDAALAVLRGDGGPRPDADDRARLLTVLLSVGDEAALDYVVTSPELDPVRFPWQKYAPELAPHEYLALRDPEPAHPYTDEQVTETLSRLATRLSGQRKLEPRPQLAARLTDAALVAFAEHDLSDYGTDWRDLAVRRLAEQLADGEPSAVLDRWFRSTLGRPDHPSTVVAAADEAVYRRYRDAVLALLERDDEEWAYRALICVARYEPARLDVGALLQSRHGKVRWWAVDAVSDGKADVEPSRIVPLLGDDQESVRRTAALHLGNVLCIEAVPGLIAQLRDPAENVRKVAAESLTKIRFYQEQKAHWDRVLKGLDASPASATEKLLLQAKPGEDKQQRVLAIRSLGVLGKPEALPFLIEWARDPDRDVASEANTAITKIHLDPKK